MKRQFVVTYTISQTEIFASFISSSLITQFLHKLHKIKCLYMFRASSAHPQEVSVLYCTCMQPLVFSEYQRLHTCTINDTDLLRVGG